MDRIVCYINGHVELVQEDTSCRQLMSSFVLWLNSLNLIAFRIIMKIAEFRRKLALLFDDDTRTVVWKNYLDYVIWSLIVLSTVEIFLSTYVGIAEKYGAVLDFIDIFTTIFFTIEVSLRIWTIDLINPKYSGFWGRVRYCLSFYGLIDFVSTYTYYVNFLFPLPLSALKAIRVARLLRVFRFMKSFRLLTQAIGSKSKELFVSLQFLAIVTIILSFVLFFAEHDAQPDVYCDGLTPVLWAFMQYIGDPGGFGDYPPVTFVGRVIACIIGVLGIAIFAVPAGLIGSGFTEAMEKEDKAEKTLSNVEKLKQAFRSIQCRYTKLLYVPKYVSLVDIMAKQFLSENEIIEAVAACDSMRLRNLATARPIDERPEDKMVVENFPLNRSYGCCIDRGSNVTIVNTSNNSEAAIGCFSFYLAALGGFNYVSKEVVPEGGENFSYYNPREDMTCPNFSDFMDDVNNFAQRNGSWVVTLLSASGGQEPVYPSFFHYVIGCKKGQVDFADPNCLVKDVEAFRNMYDELSDNLMKDFNFESDIHKYHTSGARNVNRLFKTNNTFTIRIAWSLTAFDYRSFPAALLMANAFRKHFAGMDPIEVPKQFRTRVPGKDFSYEQYDL